jgi:hypothetical protein
MVEPTDAAMRIGARVTGRLFPAPAAPDAAASKLELRFSLIGPSGRAEARS